MSKKDMLQKSSVVSLLMPLIWLNPEFNLQQTKIESGKDVTHTIVMSVKVISKH